MHDENVSKEHKSRLFAKLFGDEKNKKDLLSLFNALNNTDYTDEEALQITTIESVVYMGMHNDVSCIIDNHMALYEHQSTLNPNMPLRGFLYAGKLYDKYVIMQNLNLYGSKKIMLPTPQYYVFYNGVDEADDRMEMKLSDAFTNPLVRTQYEWTAVMLNINYGRNRKLMEKCKLLEDYSKCIAIVREQAKGRSDWCSAIRRAVDVCIDRGILREYLLANKAEVVDMLLTEYNEEKVMQQLRREYMEEGLQQGLQQGIAVLIETCRELEQSKETAAKKVCQKYKLTQEEAEELVERYW